jgi:hypothetical protein
MDQNRTGRRSSINPTFVVWLTVLQLGTANSTFEFQVPTVEA